MIKKVIFFLLLTTMFATLTFSADLYRVKISNGNDAEFIRSLDIEPVFQLNDGYLILAENSLVPEIEKTGISIELIATGILLDQIVMDHRHDRANVDRYQLIFEIDDLRFYRVGSSRKAISQPRSFLGPVDNSRLEIDYIRPKTLHKNALTNELDLESLIGLVDQDSVTAYLMRLEAFYRRLTGTDSCFASSAWLASKFAAFGYDSIVLDTFIGSQLWDYLPVTSRNVYAVKVGTRYPDRQIIIGSHLDAVPDCPGADDNGSGTAGVLEIARVMADIETEMTFIFIPFDSEESWMWGSYHYADAAAARGDNIIYMMNLDMIGHYDNSAQANLYYGPVRAYSELWSALADSLVGIHGVLSGQTASDHLPFIDNGYDVTFVQERNFSTEYHQPSDSTSYINFEYMTRMIKASLANVYVIDKAPLPASITSIRDGGDGQSLQINWEASDPAVVDHYAVYFDTEPASGLDSVLVGSAVSTAMVTGLTLGQEYAVYVLAFDNRGKSSIVYTIEYATPYERPAIPSNLAVRPLYRAIELVWETNNTELDFSHYTLVRDGEVLPYSLSGTSFIDYDYSLGSDLHAYFAVAVDLDGNISDTIGIAAMEMRAATLNPGRILAVNRSGSQSPLIVDESLTGQYLIEAMTGFDYDYMSDTVYSFSGRTDTLQLIDMIDYELIVIGGEAGRTDDIGCEAMYGGILDTLDYYLSIGGKVIIFGRWGDLKTAQYIADTNAFSPGVHDYGYNQFFHMNSRVSYLTTFDQTTLGSDLIGVHSQQAGYPDIAWDSMATLTHSPPWVEVGGIPCPTFGILTSGPEIIYTYDSRDDLPLTEGQPIGWKYFGADYQYIFFEFPMSFMQRPQAVAALQYAVSEMISTGPAALTIIDPNILDFQSGVPETISIYLGNLADGQTAADVDPNSIMINYQLSPLSFNIVGPFGPFTGNVAEIILGSGDFASLYDLHPEADMKSYFVSWQYYGDQRTWFIGGEVTLSGRDYLTGDSNGDGTVNLGDASYLINYIFYNGSAPDPIEAGDANCDSDVNLGDAGYIINYIFFEGDEPACP